MTQDDAPPRPWRICLLAAAPGALYLSWIIAQTLNAGRFVQASILLPAAALAILYLAHIVRAHRLPVWALTGIGLAFPALLGASWDLLFPAPAVAMEPPAARQLAAALLPGIWLTLYAGLLWIAYRRAPTEGPAAALLLVGPVTLLAHTIMDPTYGFFIYVDSLSLDSRALAAAAEALILLPALIFLPLWVLRAPSRRAQTWRLLAMSALSLELMALTPLITAVARAQHNVLNAPPLSEAIPYTLLTGTTFAAFFWGLLALVVGLTLRAPNRSPRLARS